MVLTIIIWASFFLISSQAVWSAEEKPAKEAPATYVGSEVCKACHAPAFEKFSKTEMGKILDRKSVV